MNHRDAIVLLSGGLDSSTVLAIARAKKFRCHALSFDYGQRHKNELRAARKIATALGAVEHVTVKIDLRVYGGSSLTANIAVPKHRALKSMSRGIPVTYVPARNTIFLSFALAFAEVRKASDIFIGVNALDYSGYPDCRPEYIAAYQKLANLATKAGIEGKTRIRVHTPLIRMTKAQIIKTAAWLGVDLSLTQSCYDPDKSGRACGACDSCLLRKKGFAEAHVVDTTRYRAQ